MKTSTSGAKAGRVPKTNKSCVPCRARKVKCDAARVGIPCNTCISRDHAEDCVLPNRKDRVKLVTLMIA